VLENIGSDPADAYYADLCFLKPFEARRLMGKPADRDARRSPVYEAVTAPYRRCTSSSPLQRAQYADFKIYLANDVLVKVDRMSMQHGLEVRCPLLDRRLVEMAFRMPSRSKMPRLTPKYLLRQLAAKRLPPALLRLPKHGFSAPAGAWITGSDSAMFDRDVFAADSTVRSLIDVDVVRTWAQEQRDGAIDRAQPLWGVWMLERWGRQRRTRQSGAIAAR
jgi:asparagine synthase (glutamine-hydrolysing)